MPPRWLTLAIIAFWMAMVALFNLTDVWPRLSPTAEPLLFPVDVIDEAGQTKDLVNYNVTKNGTLKYKAEVEWHYHTEDDSFESRCDIRDRWGDPEAPRAEGPAWLPQVHDMTLVSSYYLTRGGEMKAIDVRTDYSLVRGKDDHDKIRVKAEVKGSPHAGRFVPHLRLTFPGVGPDEKVGPFTVHDFERDADAVAVLPRGTVLNPLHPPRRFPDLAAGQHWRVTFIDPLALLGLAAPLDGGALRQAGIDAGAVASVLEARVQPELEGVDWDAGKGVPCRVIRCEGDGPLGPLTFWVRPKDGVVMREEFRLWGDSWSLLRNSLAYKAHFVLPPREQP